MMSHLHNGQVSRGPCQLPCAAAKRHQSHQGGPQLNKNRAPWSRCSSTLTTSNSLLVLIVTIIICFSSSASAVHAAMPVHTALPLASFADSGILLVDPRHNNQPLANKGSIPDDLRRRGNSEKTTTTTTTATTLKTTAVASSTTSSSAAAATTSASSALPVPFDTNLANNFTVSTCPTFINQFISTDTFKSCLPFSLLLQTSNSFFQAQKSSFELTATLDASCSANSTLCTDYLYSVASNLTTEANCKADFELGNPTVVEAHNGLLAYQTLYQASCLHNPTTSSYCAVDAFTNTSSPTDSYIYYLPLGSDLPGGATPTCDTCLENTMTIFQKASANRSQPIFDTYASAAQQINVLCGPTFTNQSIPAAVSSGASINSKIGSGEGVGALVLVVAAALWLF